MNSSITQLYVAASVSMVLYCNRIRRRHHLTRSGILFPSHSPWRNLYDNGDEESFLNLTGFSREAFEELHKFLYLGHQNHRVMVVLVTKPELCSASLLELNNEFNRVG